MTAPEPPYPTVTPYVLYTDVAAALEWLARAFGFRERLRFTADDGTVNHAEMDVGDGGVVMMGNPGPDFGNPGRVGVTVLLHVYLVDVDAHFAQARAAGATILREPADEAYGDRRYDAADLEGHRWSFAQRVRDVTPEQWGAVTS